MLQFVAVRCGVVQCVVECCSGLQWVAVCCSVLQYITTQQRPGRWHAREQLQCFTMCYSVLQCVAVCCSVLQCQYVAVTAEYYHGTKTWQMTRTRAIAACCSVLQRVAVCSSELQCVTVYYHGIETQQKARARAIVSKANAAAHFPQPFLPPLPPPHPPSRCLANLHWLRVPPKHHSLVARKYFRLPAPENPPCPLPPTHWC